MRHFVFRTPTPLVALVAVVAVVAALFAAPIAAPLRAQTTSAPAVVQEVKVTIQRHTEGTCSDIDDWREELTGWVGMPGTRTAYNATQSYPKGSGEAAYYGVVWRTVHAALCRARCPDGGCDGVCRFTIEATGPAELSLSGQDEGAELGIHSSPKYTNLRYGGGTCLGMHDNDGDFTLYGNYFIPELGFIPGDVSMKQLQTGLTLPVTSLGEDQVGTLEVLAGCNDRDFNPGPDDVCGAPKKPSGAKKRTGKKT